MKLPVRIYTSALCILLSATAAEAQHANTPVNPPCRHDIRISYSDGLTLGGASFWGIGLSDAITGTERTDQKSTGVFGIGYRHTWGNRFRFGMDLGVAKVSSKVESAPEEGSCIKEKELNFLVLPTAEFVYFRRNLFQLYGSAAAGADFSRHYETGITAKGKELARKDSKFETEFAYQVNPLGLRVGNGRIGGFVEAGLGYRGFITAGISLGL